MNASQPVPSDVARARFARFVRRALDAARDRGMTDREIARITGVGTSTFHRWQRGEGRELPELDRVRAFCVGVGASVDEAMRALGASDIRTPSPEPEPPLPPEVRTILRKLADPNIPQSDKVVIREMLLMLAERAEQRGRGGSRQNRAEEA